MTDPLAPEGDTRVCSVRSQRGVSLNAGLNPLFSLKQRERAVTVRFGNFKAADPIAPGVNYRLFLLPDFTFEL